MWHTSIKQLNIKEIYSNLKIKNFAVYDEGFDLMIQQGNL